MKRNRKILRKIALFVLPFMVLGSLSFSSNAREYTAKYYLSSWNIWLHENPDYINVYNSMTGMLDPELQELYNLDSYSEEFTIALIANVTCEGTPGVVEYAFSSCHQYDFYLPSGGCKIKTMDDVNYLLSWTTSDEGSVDGWSLKGSCGVSSSQWSYDRRLKWLNILKSHMQEEHRTQITEYDLNYADTFMLLTELDPDNTKYTYSKKIDKMLKGIKNPTVADYAEALCDVYFVPQDCDHDFSGEGKSCKKRREKAEELWEIYTKKGIYPYTMTLNVDDN